MLRVYVVLLLMFLSGCSLFTRDIEVGYTPVNKPDLVLPDADLLRMRNVDWIIITPDNQEQVFDELEQQGITRVLISLSAEDYEAISLNLADIRTFIQQQQSIIEALTRYYTSTNE